MFNLSQSGSNLSGILLTALAMTMTGCSPVFAMHHVAGVPRILVRRTFLGTDFVMTRTLCSPGPSQPREKQPEVAAVGLSHRLPELGRTLSHTVRHRAASTAKAWWDRYEEFVGLNEVREAQGNVTEVRRGPGRLASPPDLGNMAWAPNKKVFPATCSHMAAGKRWTRLCFLLETGSYVWPWNPCVAKLLISLCPPPECWDYRCGPPLTSHFFS